VSNSPASQHILEKLVEAARSEPTPAIDFERMQIELRQNWVGQRPREQRVPLRWHWASAAGVAVSFFMGGWYGHAHHQASLSAKSEVPQPLRVLDGRALAVGQEVRTGLDPLVINHPGVAQWTLAPEGMAKLSAKGQYLTVRLEVGRIDAEVIPSQQFESFAVEAGSLRIAVHGTTFAVQRQGDWVDVIVSAGRVVVGASGQPGNTSGAVLAAPARQRFPINPKQDSSEASQRNEPIPGPTPVRPKSSAPLPAASADKPAEPSTTHGETKLNDRPSRVELEDALDVVRAAAARCFAQAKNNDAARDSHVIVRVDTQLTVGIAPSGSITEVSFAPPVPETISECTRHEISDWSTTPSNQGSVTSRPIMLTR
jgi:hypothetical protein